MLKWRCGIRILASRFSLIISTTTTPTSCPHPFSTPSSVSVPFRKVDLHLAQLTLDSTRKNRIVAVRFLRRVWLTLWQIGASYAS